jgi:hypothetical protein
MKLIFPLIAVLIISQSAFAQSNWDSWDENYQEKNITDLLKYEKLYADSVDNGLIEGKYYLRMDNYRFPALYTGERREIPDSVNASMKRVYKMYGNIEYLPVIDQVSFEYQFKIDDSLLWISMQSILDKAFKKEVKKNDTIYLYCLFLNEHTFKGQLYNSFLISEFRK